MSDDLNTQVEGELLPETSESTGREDTRDFIARELDRIEGPPDRREPPRDAQGRYASTAGKAPEKAQYESAAAPVVGAAPQQGAAQAPAGETQPVVRSNPFSSWKKPAQEWLSSLSPEQQAWVTEREQQFHKGLDQYRDLANRAREYDRAVQPFTQYLDDIGVSLQQAIPALIGAEQALRIGSPQQKIAMLQKLCHDYDVDIRNLQSVPFDPYRYDLEQRLAQTQAALESISQSRQTAEDAQIGQTIEQFGQTHEFFEDLRETMADLLDRGFAADLEEAYAKAIRLNDEVSAKIQAKQAGNVTPIGSRADQAAKAARASAVSVKGAPTGITRRPTQKTTEDSVRAAFADLGL